MTPKFHYVDIRESTVQRLLEQGDRGQSAVIVGPRGVGKRYLVELINRHLARRGRKPAAAATFSTGQLLLHEADVIRELSHQCGLNPAAPTISAWTDAVRVAVSEEWPLRLFITSLDGLSKRLAYRLLQAIQDLTEAKLLVTLVTGEGSIIDLVDGGPTSPWACADVYVVHAHGYWEFYRFLTKRMRQMGLCFPRGLAQAKDLFRHLYELTGGDVSLLRTVLWSISDTLNLHFSCPASQPHVIERGDLPEHLMKIHIVPTAGLVPFRYALECILAAACELHHPRPGFAAPVSGNQSVPLLDDLQKLLHDEPVPVGEQPHVTELAGLTRRVDGVLQWFCPYARTFAVDHFTPWRIGDYYAFARRWDEAYAHYEQSPLEAKHRPLSDDDLPIFMRLMDGLAMNFHSLIGDAINNRLSKAAGNALEALGTELRKALQHLLGFALAEISSWSLDWQNCWRCTGPRIDLPTLPEPVRMAWEALRVQGKLRDDEVSGYDDGYHWVICRDAAQHAMDAVLVDGSNDLLRDHPARQAAVYQVLRGYRRARERWAMTEGLRERLDFSKTESRILESFWDLTSINAWGAERTLPHIVRPVLECLPAIKRLVFCVMNPATEGSVAVRPVFDSSPARSTPFDAVLVPRESLEDLAEAGPVAFTPTQGNQRWGRTGIAAFEHDGFFVVDGQLKWLLLVEGASDRPVTPGVIRLVLELARTLRPVWNQAQRLRLLHASMNAFPNLAIILDRRKRIIYANEPAVESLRLPVSLPGWQKEPVPVDASWARPAVAEALTPASATESREFPDVTERMAGVWMRDCHPLSGGDGNVGGWVLTFQNRAFLYDSFHLISELEKETDENTCLEIISERVRTLLRMPNVKLRIYLIDKSDKRRLVGFKSIGLTDPKHTNLFESEGIVFPDTDAEAWKCLSTLCPVAFKLDDTKPRSTEGHTKKGLKYLYIHRSRTADLLEKQPGDVSIDFPLVSGKEILGKLTINFTAAEAEELQPGIPMQMGALSYVLGDLLGHVSQTEIRHKKILVDHADQTLKETAHNLLSQISGFAGLVFHYRLLEPKLPALKDINDRLAAFHKHARVSMERVKERAGQVVLRLEKTDLLQSIQRALETVLADQNPPLIEDQDALTEGYWDEHQWENVFIELANNSRDFVRPGVPLQVSVTLKSHHGKAGGFPQLEIHYADNGRGVPAELKARIFEGQSYRKTVATTGHGLGMSYAKKVIEAHGGSIREAGLPGSGALFIIAVPVKNTLPSNPIQPPS